MFEDHNNIHERNSSEFIWEEIKSFAKNDVWGKDVQYKTFSHIEVIDNFVNRKTVNIFR